MVYPHNGVLSSNYRNKILLHETMYTEDFKNTTLCAKKPETKDYIFYGFPCVHFTEKGNDEKVLKLDCGGGCMAL